MAPKAKKAEQPVADTAPHAAAPEAVEEKPVTNKLPIRYETIEIEGKSYQFPMFFIAPVDGGIALFNENGVRVSPAQEADSPEGKYITKAAARFNLMRRKNARAADFRG